MKKSKTKKRSTKERVFIALFNYDPVTMSPNVETCHEELPFVEGQFIKIYGDPDSDGFFYGESLGKSGFVPYNMISEIQVDDPFILQQILNDINSPSQQSKSYNNNSNNIHHKHQKEDRKKHKNVYQMIALYDYDPQSLSPNADLDVI